jgi:hypothetical protein
MLAIPERCLVELSTEGEVYVLQRVAPGERHVDQVPLLEVPLLEVPLLEVPLLEVPLLETEPCVAHRFIVFPWARISHAYRVSLHDAGRCNPPGDM